MVIFPLLPHSLTLNSGYIEIYCLVSNSRKYVLAGTNTPTNNMQSYHRTNIYIYRITEVRTIENA